MTVMSRVNILLSLLLQGLRILYANKHLHQHHQHEPISNASVLNFAGHYNSVDEGIHYQSISVFDDEWALLTKDSKIAHSPIHMWFRCVEREVRGYMFIEDTGKLDHNKEAWMPTHDRVRDKFKMKADEQPVSLRTWNGGVDLFFNITPEVKEDHIVDITIEGIKHYARFPVSSCQKQRPRTKDTKYVMHIHLKDFKKPTEINDKVLDGIANHAHYHRCALKLNRYEVVIQREQLPYYLANRKIVHAVNEGYLHFLIRNPFNPGPMHMPHQESNCYYQAYTQNLALLQHWKENTKIYFWDSDEYMNFAPTLTSADFFKMINSHTAVGFDRYMTFCKSCPQGKAEEKHLSFTNSKYFYISNKLRDPKLLVDPNRVGCYIVHWAGCGDETKVLPIEKAHIMHFENLYTPRWTAEARAPHGAEINVTISRVNTMCDPSTFDWKSKTPSFHGEFGVYGV